MDRCMLQTRLVATLDLYSKLTHVSYIDYRFEQFEVLDELLASTS